MCRTCPLLHRTDICGVVQRLPRRVSVPQAQVRFLPPLLMKFTAMKILTLIIKQKWFDAKCFDYLRRHYPQDLEKIYKVFPLSRNILLRHDAENK